MRCTTARRRSTTGFTPPGRGTAERALLEGREGDGQPYIGKVTLNGKPLERSYVRHEELLAGGELRFVMQSKPNKKWATRPDSRPYSLSPY